MELLLVSFDGTMTQALIVGAIVGAFAGIITFTASSASERTHYIVLGALIGGLLVAAYQGLQLASLWGIDLFSGETTGTAGEVLLTSLLRIAGAAFLGGVITLAFVAPARAFLGGIGGIVVGIVASLLLWLVLQYLGETLPLLLYGIAVLAVMLFIFESISRA
jgi:hypothetical protein